MTGKKKEREAEKAIPPLGENTDFFHLLFFLFFPLKQGDQEKSGWKIRRWPRFSSSTFTYVIIIVSSSAGRSPLFFIILLEAKSNFSPLLFHINLPENKTEKLCGVLWTGLWEEKASGDESGGDFYHMLCNPATSPPIFTPLCTFFFSFYRWSQFRCSA